MAITVTTTVLDAKLVIAGLAAGENKVPHGLGSQPSKVQIEPTSNTTVYEYQAADATNLYLESSDAGGCTAYVER
jgi:hypothetical protein